MSDAAMAERDEMPNRRKRRRTVIDLDEGKFDIRHAFDYLHGRQSEPLIGGDEIAQARIEDQNSIGPPPAHKIDIRALS